MGNFILDFFLKKYKNRKYFVLDLLLPALSLSLYFFHNFSCEVFVSIFSSPHITQRTKDLSNLLLFAGCTWFGGTSEMSYIHIISCLGGSC